MNVVIILSSSCIPSNVQQTIGQNAMLRAQSALLKARIRVARAHVVNLYSRCEQNQEQSLVLVQQSREQYTQILSSSRDVLYHKQRLLCIDDDADTCDLMKFYLEREGYEMIFASTAAEGSSKIRSEHFDLYIIDNQLPDGSGIDLARQIRALDAKTPIIFHSGHAYPKDLQTASEIGGEICTYITKPSDPDTVVKAINALLVKPNRVKLDQTSCAFGKSAY